MRRISVGTGSVGSVAMSAPQLVAIEAARANVTVALLGS